ncbi:MAG: hypothetical protein ACYC96_08120 [Fimbriimonadaceae bacterium]
MDNAPLCGDRRCTLESAETLVRTYMDGYDVHVRKLKKEDVDRLHPSLTRVKTEIDEVHELLESAKKQGASAWDSMKGAVQSGLDKLTENYHAVIHDEQSR